MSDFLNDYYNFKIIEAVSEYRKARKELKKLNERKDELESIANALIEEHNRLNQIGDYEGLEKLKPLIKAVDAEVLALTAEFKRFNGES